MTNQVPDVQLVNIHKRYGEVAAVKGIDLDVRRGEMVSFLGPSGCGKTTTLRMIAGLEEPDVGEIMIRGQTMNQVPTHRRNLGMVFQNYALFPHMSVHENIAFGLLMRKELRVDIDKKVKDVMKLIRLEGMALRLPSQLSGGQRQRIGLARALYGQPALVVLEEPNSNLDDAGEAALVTAIGELRAKGTTVILVTHRPSVLAVVDKLLVLQDGTQKLFGPRDQVLKALLPAATTPAVTAPTNSQAG